MQYHIPPEVAWAVSQEVWDGSLGLGVCSFPREHVVAFPFVAQRLPVLSIQTVEGRACL